MKRLLLLLATTWLMSLLLLSLPSPSSAETVVVNGADGAAGAPGSALPGTDGQSADAAASLDPINEAVAQGGRGGAGSTSPGGATHGAGGNGGDAAANATAGDPATIIPVRSRAEATGGAGGNPGASPAFPSDADAGNGGQAIATSSTIGRSGGAEAVATGGNGASSLGTGRPGLGGSAASRASTEVTRGATVNSMAVGGSGGSGGSFGGASPLTPGSGHRGGSATSVSTVTLNASQTGSSGFLRTSAIATGGNGGSAKGAGERGGDGGTARAQIQVMKDTGVTIAVVEQTGGAGGSGINGADGGGGADSHILNTSSFQNSSSLDLKQTATAGGGGFGSILGRQGDASSLFDFAGQTNATVLLEADGRAAVTGTNLRSSSEIRATLLSTGADSATASASAITDTASAVTLDVTSTSANASSLGRIYGESAGGDVTISATVTGDIAPVTVVDALDGQTRGSLSLRQDAVGRGSVRGEVRKSASAGALSVISTATSPRFTGMPETKSSTAEANNDAGSASVSSEADSSGDAESLAIATTSGSGHDVTVSGKASGVGISRSESRGAAIDGAVSVNDSALGTHIGDSMSRGIGTNAGVSSVQVSSLAGGRFVGRLGGQVDAHATASSQGSAIADATAKGGRDSAERFRALAEASGASGRAHAISDGSWLGRSVSSVSADASASGSGSKSALATTGDATVVPMAAALQMHQAFSVVATEPATSQVLAALATNPNVSNEIGTGSNSTLLALGVVGAGSPTDGASESITNSAVIDLSVRLGAPTSPGEQLKLGFLDASVVGGGFDSVRLRVLENQLVFFDQTFTSIAAALAFFDDQTLDLASPVPGSIAGVSLQILLEVTTSSANQGFGTGFLLAFVPEPGLGVLLWLGVFAWSRRMPSESAH